MPLGIGVSTACIPIQGFRYQQIYCILNALNGAGVPLETRKLRNCKMYNQGQHQGARWSSDLWNELQNKHLANSNTSYLIDEGQWSWDHFIGTRFASLTLQVFTTSTASLAKWPPPPGTANRVLSGMYTTLSNPKIQAQTEFFFCSFLFFASNWRSPWLEVRNPRSATALGSLWDGPVSIARAPRRDKTRNENQNPILCNVSLWSRNSFSQSDLHNAAAVSTLHARYCTRKPNMPLPSFSETVVVRCACSVFSIPSEHEDFCNPLRTAPPRNT